MRKLTKKMMISFAAMSVCVMPAISNAAIVNAPVSNEVFANQMESRKVVLLSDAGDIASNSKNISRINNLITRHEKRERIQNMQQIKKCCGVAVSADDRLILERIVEAEAGGEDHKGKVLVANVVLNRVKSKEFPSNIKDVVFANNGRTYQFSPISDGRYYTVTVSEDTKSAVDDALNGYDYSMGALYFMERSIADSHNVSWFDNCLTRLFRYHCHEFYK